MHGAPVMRPVAGSMLSPAGKPIALKVSGLTSGSEALMARSTADPTMVDWLPGFERLGGVFTNVAAAWRHCTPKLSIQLPERP